MAGVPHRGCVEAGSRPASSPIHTIQVWLNRGGAWALPRPVDTPIGGPDGFGPYRRDLDPWHVDFAGPEPATYPVPDLVACVLPDGQVGVFAN